ncbi:MAG: GntR family transcriptional regulator [Desulfobacteraceae bacterium]|nr:GntR family transcriptional regulator [Desulfobacteraceae bacterium]
MKVDIYNQLHQRIIYLEYKPGQILKEQELAKEFGISRTPIRTVLFRLEWEHLVKILPRTGIQVMELELNTITNVFEARLELESVIGSMAAERFDKSHFNELQGFITICDRLVDLKDPRALGDLDFKIKHLFYKVAGNPFLTQMSDQLYSLTFRLWFFNLLKMYNEDWNQEVLSIREDLVSLCDLLKNATPKIVGKERRNQLLKHLKRIQGQFLGLSNQ